MQRVNIYLDDTQLDLLRRISTLRGRPVAQLVREALDAWLTQQGVRRVNEQDWRRRLDALLERRSRLAGDAGWDDNQVDRDVAAAVSQVRRRPPARSP